MNIGIGRGRLGAALPLAALLIALGAVGGARPAGAAAMESLDAAICRIIERAAHDSGIPVGFLTRIIWRESSFRAAAVSPKGAQGIAQFMPETAAERGLADPFDPEQAIPKAARFLAELKGRFGNLGLAAAAYNAGPARFAGWREGHGGLPAETRAYVLDVTGFAAEEWAGKEPPAAGGATAGSCLAVAAELRRGGGGAPLAPWGVQLAGNFSKARALAAFERARARYAKVLGAVRPMILGRLLRSRGTRTFYQVRVPADSRAEAEALCRKIRAIGGACVALRS